MSTSTFPVTGSTLSGAAIAKLLRLKYNLGANSECKIFRTGINHLYVVTDGNKKYVFRVYTHNWRTRAEIAEELRLLNVLNASEIPVSYPIPDISGEWIQTLNAPEGERFGVLFSFAGGEKIVKFSPVAAYNVGVAMAEMHQITENIVLQRTTYSPEVFLVDSVRNITMLFGDTSSEMQFLQQLAGFLKVQFSQMDQSQLRQGAVHLDIWFDNLHFINKERVVFFDFDFCGNAWLVGDVAYFLFQLFNTHQGDQDFEIKAVEFMKGYTSVRQLCDEEHRVVPVVVLGIALFYMGVQCERFDNWSNIFLTEEHLKRYIAMLKKWMGYHKIVII